MRVLSMLTLILVIHHVIYTEETNMGNSRDSRFIRTNDFVLSGHVFLTVQSVDEVACTRLCMQTDQCKSANHLTDGGNCELNNKKKTEAVNDVFIKKKGWVYMEKMTCQSNYCINGGVCNTIYQSKVDEYSCRCPIGFIGRYCQTAISGYRKDFPANSCKEIYDQLPSSPTGVYYFKQANDSTPYQAYCIMDVINNCGGGGWSLVMKINGNKTTFHYNSTYWSNKQSYEPKAGQSGLDTVETKTPFYWSTSFNYVCLGMRIGHVTRWMKVAHSANSLYDVISGGRFASLPSTITVSLWRNLVPGSSMQTRFTRMGFNIKGVASDRALINSRARIGLLGNNEADLLTPDSRIGFGTGGTGRDEDDSNSCGNEAASDLGADNGRVSMKAFCYVLIQ